MKRLPALLLAMVLVACGTRPQQPAAHPDWSYNSVVYEMNVRQYTPEGTLAAAARHLPRLQKLGVDVVWLMPVYPIGVKERKGTLGRTTPSPTTKPSTPNSARWRISTGSWPKPTDSGCA